MFEIKIKPDRQSTYSVTLWRFRVSICYGANAITNNMSVCLYSCLSYSASKSYLTCAVLYCRPWPVGLCQIFTHYFIKGAIFEKKALNMKCAFWFSLQLLSETFLIPRRIQRDAVVYVHSHHLKYPLFLSYFSQTWIFSTDFRKMFKFKISWKSIHQEPAERQTWQSR